MAGNKLSIPLEVSSSTIKAAFGGSMAAIKYSRELTQRLRPGYIQPEVLARQAILKHFEHKFGIVSNLLEPGISPKELTSRVALTTEAVAESGLVDDSNTAIEIRSLLPLDAVRNTSQNNRRLKVEEMMRKTLAQTYDTEAILYSHPILPSEHDTPIDTTKTWGAVALEFDGLSHQMPDKPQDHLAILAITGPSYMENFFGPQIVSSSEGRVQDSFLVLENVGALPHQNVLGRRSPYRVL